MKQFEESEYKAALLLHEYTLTILGSTYFSSSSRKTYNRPGLESPEQFRGPAERIRSSGVFPGRGYFHRSVVASTAWHSSFFFFIASQLLGFGWRSSSPSIYGVNACLLCSTDTGLCELRFESKEAICSSLLEVFGQESGMPDATVLGLQTFVLERTWQVGATGNVGQN